MKRILMMMAAVVLVCLMGCNAKGSHRHAEAEDAGREISVMDTVKNAEVADSAMQNEVDSLDEDTLEYDIRALYSKRNKDNYYSVYKKPLPKGGYRDFFFIHMDNGYVFAIYDSQKNRFYDHLLNADDYLDHGVPGMYGFVSPDGRYVYVVGDIMANSTGWIATFAIYQVNTSTLKVKLIYGAAAVKLGKNGFIVASMYKCLTPDASCSAETDFLFRDITFGFDGKVKRKSRAYPSKEIEKRYGKSLNNIKGIGIVRGE